MIDIKPFISEKIEDIVSVELSFNDSLISLPVAVMTETLNEAKVIIGNKERISDIGIQLDIYAKTPKETEELAVIISERLIGAGFWRSFSESIFSERLPRKCMRFTCTIDEVTGQVLRT